MRNNDVNLKRKKHFRSRYEIVGFSSVSARMNCLSFIAEYAPSLIFLSDLCVIL